MYGSLPFVILFFLAGASFGFFLAITLALFVAAPIYLLYEVGIFFAKIAARRRNKEDIDEELPALEVG